MRDQLPKAIRELVLDDQLCGTTSAGQRLTAERAWGSAPNERPDLPRKEPGLAADLPG
jgi:hypothetical protein